VFNLADVPEGVWLSLTSVLLLAPAAVAAIVPSDDQLCPGNGRSGEGAEREGSGKELGRE
jgi:hypothetical protein